MTQKIQTELTTKASAKLSEEVEKELEKPDPLPGESQAILSDEPRCNPDTCDCRKDKETDDA